MQTNLKRLIRRALLTRAYLLTPHLVSDGPEKQAIEDVCRVDDKQAISFCDLHSSLTPKFFKY